MAYLETTTINNITFIKFLQERQLLYLTLTLQLLQEFKVLLLFLGYISATAKKIMQITKIIKSTTLNVPEILGHHFSCKHSSTYNKLEDWCQTNDISTNHDNCLGHMFIMQPLYNLPTRCVIMT